MADFDLAIAGEARRPKSPSQVMEVMVRISGRVRDGDTNQSLAGVEVRGLVDDREIFVTRTDPSGHFRYDGGPKHAGGRICLRLMREGYESKETENVLANGELHVDIRLFPGRSASMHSKPGTIHRQPAVEPVVRTLSGVVRRRDNRRPIENATVTITSGSVELGSIDTDTDGVFVLQRSLSDYEGKTIVVVARKAGFGSDKVSQILPSDGLQNIELLLAPATKSKWLWIAAVIAALLVLVGIAASL